MHSLIWSDRYLYSDTCKIAVYHFYAAGKGLDNYMYMYMHMYM